jgi:hypothetical protein
VAGVCEVGAAYAVLHDLSHGVSGSRTDQTTAWDQKHLDWFSRLPTGGIPPMHNRTTASARRLARRSALAALVSALTLGTAPPEGRADPGTERTCLEDDTSSFFCTVTDDGTTRSRTIDLKAKAGDPLGKVTLETLRNGGGYDLHVCDDKRDGLYVHGQVESASGDWREYHDPDGSSGPCTVHRLLYGVHRFRAIAEDDGRSTLWSPWPERGLEVRSFRPPTRRRKGWIDLRLAMPARVEVIVEEWSIFGYRPYRRLLPVDYLGPRVRPSIPRLRRPGRYRVVVHVNGVTLGDSYDSATRRFRVHRNPADKGGKMRQERRGGR